MLEKYLKVKTGQDLLDQGVIPKTSSDHLALIIYKRLVALRDRTLMGINEDILGKWQPLLKPNVIEVGEEVSDRDNIEKYAAPNIRVRINTNQSGVTKGLEGVIQNIDSRYKTAFIKLDDGRQVNVNIVNFNLLIPDGKLIDSYSLNEGVVADKQLGHKVRFTAPYRFAVDGGYGSSSTVIDIPEGIKGILVDYKPQAQQVVVRVDEGIPEQGRKKNFGLSVLDAYKILRVSSLGQIEPLDKETEVKKQVLLDLFPRTVLDTDRAEKVTIGMLMANDMVLYGPPGGGKSQLAKDLILLAKQQQYIFTVEGCQVQCNPFSLFDETFSQEAPPCPECLIEYGPDFKTTGIFNRPKPKDVKVTIAKYGDGHGIEYAEGTDAIVRMHLAGFKLPNLNGNGVKGNNEYDPEGYSPGAIPRTNNGILHFDEMDKLRPTVQDSLLEPLNSSRMKPDQLRYPYPANSLLLGTANDNTRFSEAFNDRVLLLAIRYPEDPDACHAILRRSYHKEITLLKETPLGDTHVENGRVLRSIPMPSIIERAVASLYMKIRNEYNGSGKKEIFGSNRSTLNALDAARARLILDQVFYDDAPKIVNAKYAVFGVQYAVCARVQERNREEGQKAKSEFIKWAEQQFPDVLKGEENTWWCKLYKNIAVATTQIKDTQANFVKELKWYEEDLKQNALGTWQKLKAAYENTNNQKAQLSKVHYPFMAHLFKEQPRIMEVNTDQLYALVGYYLDSRNSTTCKLVGEAETSG